MTNSLFEKADGYTPLRLYKVEADLYVDSECTCCEGTNCIADDIRDQLEDFIDKMGVNLFELSVKVEDEHYRKRRLAERQRMADKDGVTCLDCWDTGGRPFPETLEDCDCGAELTRD